jgi:prepilin-type N-terminal cleavage/methylation domain-containing protein
MKTITSHQAVESRAGFVLLRRARESRVESRANPAPLFFRPRPSSLVPRPAFTLIELLVVIAIMGVLASLILPVATAVKRHQYLYTARAELAALETAIDNYKAAYGFYPPDNHSSLNTVPDRFKVNQLYYELTGTVYKNAAYQSLNDPSQQTLTDANINDSFGVGGFMNCTRPGSGEDSAAARNFLPDLKPKQIWYPYTNRPASVGVALLVTSVGGPDQNYQPLGMSDKNPWRYNSSNPTNNPGAYDLWVQLSIGSSTNDITHASTPKLYLICNWNKQVPLNNPLP